MTGNPRVQFENIGKRYPGVQALDNVSFPVAPGTVHAVVGENGAGKSTLMKVLAGATRPDSGVIRLDGEIVNIRNARQAQLWGIAAVYQEFSLAGDLSVAENVFLGRWPRKTLRLISYRRLHAQSADLFRALGVKIDVRQRVAGLSVAQQQMVEIARALSLSARVVLLDEPSAVLTPNELGALFELVLRLTREGVSVLYISHRLDEIFELCSHVTVLRDGRHISTRSVDKVTKGTLIHEMVGRPIEEEFPRRSCAVSDPVLHVEGLTCPGRFRDVSFELRAREVLALTGLVGSGRSSVAKAVFGAIRSSGRVWIASGTPLPAIERGRGEGGEPRWRGSFRSPREAQSAGIAFLPEDRKGEGLLLHRSLRENITLAHLDSVSHFGLLRPADERHIARQKIAELQIRTRGDAAPAANLSGGNQQKVMIARWLQRHYPVIILDEPTRGVDVGAKVEIYRLINRMAAEGSGVLLITSELPEAIGMADRIGVMARGNLAGVLDNQHRDVRQEQLLKLAIGEAATTVA